MMERLQKVIAKSGVTSRRKAEQLILDGKVKVNDKIINALGYKVSEKDIITIDKILLKPEEKVYLVLNKPKNCISSVSDDRGRITVMNYLKDIDKRIFPIGRLDYDTTGVLLFSNDGELANKLLHPSFEISKVYIATIKGIFTEKDKSVLEKGIIIEDKKTAPCKIIINKTLIEENKTIVEVVLHEGFNRQVKKMFEHLNFKVLKLHREKFAGVDVKKLKSGQYRFLTKDEIVRLKNC